MIFNLKDFFSLFGPGSDCYLCLQSIKINQQQPQLICLNCHNRLPFLKNACVICAMPLISQNQLASASLTCGDCLKQSPCYSKTVSAFHYEPPVSDFITGLKYNAKHILVPLLSYYLLEAIKLNYEEDELPELIIPVALHQKKIRLRGFNQAQLIAENLAAKLAIPILTSELQRIRYTKAQSSLSANERKRNLKGAFIVKNNEIIKNKRVAIVDDVVTTGTTANELSSQLLAAGAHSVDVWCVARAFSL